jgi:membrane-bound lytic murein transglycosylase D
LRLALFGGCCTALGGACLLLAACASGPTYNAAPAAGPEPVAAPPPPPPAVAPAPPPLASKVAANRFHRLGRAFARFAMPGCGHSPSVQHWAHMYAQAPNDFSSSLSEAMPYLLLVLEQIEKHRLPGEFAFLPYVESNYTAIASTGDRAAGIWQLMPDTAREAGLRIADDYEGRLTCTPRPWLRSAAAAVQRRIWRLAPCRHGLQCRHVQGLPAAEQSQEERMDRA